MGEEEASLSSSPSLITPPPSPRFRASSIATATGSSMIVAAVLLIHMLSPAAASMNPATTRRGEVPVKRSVCRASRSWTCHRSSPSASRKPPRYRKTR